ncbi:hypothetical protein H9P43_003071 [Blastocladiella emersonii ATCC 22665]|nr:hypothetical protein H9P43_003071 [Blastocladiella emersonii ATCC 22665]
MMMMNQSHPVQPPTPRHRVSWSPHTPSPSTAHRRTSTAAATAPAADATAQLRAAMTAFQAHAKDVLSLAAGEYDLGPASGAAASAASTNPSFVQLDSLARELLSARTPALTLAAAILHRDHPASRTALAAVYSKVGAAMAAANQMVAALDAHSPPAPADAVRRIKVAARATMESVRGFIEPLPDEQHSEMRVAHANRAAAVFVHCFSEFAGAVYAAVQEVVAVKAKLSVRTQEMLDELEDLIAREEETRDRRRAFLVAKEKELLAKYVDNPIAISVPPTPAKPRSPVKPKTPTSAARWDPAPPSSATTTATARTRSATWVPPPEHHRHGGLAALAAADVPPSWTPVTPQPQRRRSSTVNPTSAPPPKPIAPRNPYANMPLLEHNRANRHRFAVTRVDLTDRTERECGECNGEFGFLEKRVVCKDCRLTLHRDCYTTGRPERIQCGVYTVPPDKPHHFADRGAPAWVSTPLSPRRAATARSMQI